MTSPKQRGANRRNAHRSTGPTSAAGKAIVAQNASKHGMAAAAVIPGLERVEEWEAHRAGIIGALAPVGQLELGLAERVALSSWRLQRVARYERETIVLRQEGVEEEFIQRSQLSFGRIAPDRAPQKVRAELQDRQEQLRLFERFSDQPETTEFPADTITTLDRVASRVGVRLYSLRLPKALREMIEGEVGCTTGLTRQLLTIIAQRAGKGESEVLDGAMSSLGEGLATLQAELAKIERVLDGMRRERLLPTADEMNKVQRYEAHLSRQFYQALHEFQRLQQARAGQYVPPPVAVTVSGEPLPATLDTDRTG